MRTTAVGLMALFIAGCGPDEEPKETVDTGEPAVTDGPLDDLSCSLGPVAPQVLQCSWTTEEPGRGYVTTYLDGEPAVVTPYGASGTEHSVRAVGLKAGRDYTYRAFVETDSGEILEGEERSFSVAVPEWAANSTVTGTPSHNYVLTASIDEDTARPVIYDADGDMVWHYPTEIHTLITTTRLSHDGKSVLFARYDMEHDEDIGAVIRVALDGTEVVETRALLAHHAFLEHDDGDISWLSYEYETIDPDEWVSDVIRRTPEGTLAEDDHEVLFSWFDDYAYEPWVFDDLQENFSLGDADFEWTHTNSLMQVDDQSYYVMSKFLDCVLKLDLDGNVLWQMGGLYGTFTNPDGSDVFRSLDDYDLWSHAHMSHLWDGGMVVFDNGYNYNGGLSRIVEYAFDEQTQIVEEVFSYDEPDAGFTKLMGDVRKLPGGNYLAGWSNLKYISEVTPGGEIAWQMTWTGASPARITPFDDLYDAIDASAF